MTVKEYLKKVNMEDKYLIHDNLSDTVKHASEVLKCFEGQIAKSMSFWIKDTPIIIVCAGDTKIDNHKYKEYFKEKAKMINYDDVLNVIGHPPGGVCPFCVNEGVIIYLDESLKRFLKVYAAGGSCDTTVELTILELEKHSDYKEWIDVCKIKDN